MKNYQQHNFGKLSEISQYTFAPEDTPINIPGKLFLKEKLGLTSMEISINKEAPGTGMNFYHRHKGNEETYIFIGGKGEMIIDEDRFAIGEGSVVSVKPEAKRAWWNTGDKDLYYIVVQAPANGFQGSSVDDGELIEGTVPWV
ncbi:MAG: cupin domain-containing protein [Gammaproteobacteria bacterium]|nr:cupin domain-containing protein [Gammaproteobacteria bacterium]